MEKGSWCFLPPQKGCSALLITKCSKGRLQQGNFWLYKRKINSKWLSTRTRSQRDHELLAFGDIQSSERSKSLSKLKVRSEGWRPAKLHSKVKYSTNLLIIFFCFPEFNDNPEQLPWSGRGSFCFSQGNKEVNTHRMLLASCSFREGFYAHLTHILSPLCHEGLHRP